MTSNNVYLVGGLRSPIGSFGGALSPLRSTDIGSIVASTLLKRLNLKPDVVERVIAGTVLQDMTESNPARIISQRINVPDSAAAFTINMQCCSGMTALNTAAQQIALGEVDCMLVAGIESMSNAPHMVPGSRWGHRYAHGEFIDTLVECTLAGSKMWKKPQYMIDVAENHANTDGVNREEMDQYSIVSHTRALDAIDSGRLDDEIVPIEVPGRKGKTTIFSQDENPRRDINMETLSSLPSVRPGGFITAGNAASINDGAAAALICSEKGLAKLGVDPLAKILMPGTALVGCAPQLMGYSCVDALNLSLKAADKKLDDLDLIECNEGFSVQLLACARMGKWPSERLNVDGGSIGFGHPVGMSGLRIAIHLANALKQRGLKLGGATVPAGSGLGASLLLESL